MAKCDVCSGRGYLDGSQCRCCRATGEEPKKTINNMELHDTLEIDKMEILRVPGGWLYSLWDWDNDCRRDPVFVPSVLHNKHWIRSKA